MDEMRAVEKLVDALTVYMVDWNELKKTLAAYGKPDWDVVYHAEIERVRHEQAEVLYQLNDYIDNRIRLFITEREQP